MRLQQWMALAAASSWLVGCSGGGGESPTSAVGPAPGPAPAPVDTSQPTSAVGRIDAFGSVFVNGVEFDTSRANFTVRGASAANDSALSVGMVVHLTGTRDDSGHGVATDIHFDADIDGPVTDVAVDETDATIKRFKIFGQDVLATATTVFKTEDGGVYAFADLANGDHVEVSGDFDGTLLIASFVDKQSATDTTFEVKGTVSGLSGSTFVLTLTGGSTLNVTLDAGATLPAGLADGSVVVLHGTVPDATMPLAFLASSAGIEDHTDVVAQDGGADLGGALTLDGTTWSIRGTPLMFSSTTLYRPEALAAEIADGTAAGLRVHVLGTLVDGVLNVERIRADGRADGRDELRLEGLLSGIGGSSNPKSAPTDARAMSVPTTVVPVTITMSFPPATGSIDVILDANTLMMDDPRFTGERLSSLVPGETFIQVRAKRDADGVIVANSLHVEEHQQNYEVSGPVDAGGYVADASISVIGVKFNIDANTKFMGGTPDDQTFVDVKDGDTNGFADTIGLEKQHGADALFARPDHAD